MQTVYFIDTSVLTNILDIPDRNQNKDMVKEKMKELINLKARFVLPLATIIETGNHIAHIADGNLRRNRAELLSDMIKLILEDKSPWTYNKTEISNEDLLKISEGFPNYAQQHNMGLGDLSILAEYTRYKNQKKKRLNVKLWSLDGHLKHFEDIEEI